MAVNTPQAGSITRSFLCAADVSTLGGYIVSLDEATANTVALGTPALREEQVGVIVDGGTGANTPVSVCIRGVARVVAAEAIDIGQGVFTDAAGKAIGESGDGSHLIGRTLEAAAADGDMIMIDVGYFVPGAIIA